jgi:hypothetical protein
MDRLQQTECSLPLWRTVNCLSFRLWFLELDDDSGTHLFVHVRDCQHEVPLAIGDRVSFVRKTHPDGRVRARNEQGLFNRMD